MVCLSSRSPNAPRLLRKAARLADRLERPVVRRLRPDAGRAAGADGRGDAAADGRHADAGPATRRHADDVQGRDFAAAVAEFVREYGINVILVGRSQRPWYRRWFAPSPLDRLLVAVPDVDILIFATQSGSHEE